MNLIRKMPTSPLLHFDAAGREQKEAQEQEQQQQQKLVYLVCSTISTRQEEQSHFLLPPYSLGQV